MKESSASYRDNVRYVRKEATWTFWQVLWMFILVSVVIGVVGFVFTLLSRPAQVIEKVTDPNRIIQNYEWYEETYNDALAFQTQIQATQAQIDALVEGLPEDRSTWSRTDREEYNRINAVLLGLRTHRANVVADYNARSKMITRNLFKGAALPYQLSIVEDRITEDWVK